MKTFAIAVLGAALLVVPAGAVAKPHHDAEHAALKQCKAERGKGKHHGVRRCARLKVANAAKECKAERSDPNFAAAHDGKEFDEFYGTNANGRNAFGKCVSTNVREDGQADDADEDEQSEEGTEAEEHGLGHCQSDDADESEPEDG